jgi:hypothetical protein
MVKVGLGGIRRRGSGRRCPGNADVDCGVVHAAKRLGADAAAVSREASAISGAAFAAVLLDFAKRPEGLQTLAYMG